MEDLLRFALTMLACAGAFALGMSLCVCWGKMMSRND